MFIKQKKCFHCDPYPYDTQAHIWGRLERILFPIQHFFRISESFLKIKFPNSFIFLNRVAIVGLFKIMSAVGILNEANVSEDDERLCSRIIVIISSAHKRNIKIKVLKIFNKWNTNFFSLTKEGKKIVFEGLPSIKVGYIPLCDFDDKFTLEKILQDNNMPNAEGQVFYNSKAALLYAKKFGFPLVVKPRYGSLSKHTICNIQNEYELIEAIRIVHEISREFILEKFIVGNVYRITIVNNNLVVCCFRELPNIIGDGIHSIEELVRTKNNNPLRGDINQKNFTLHKIPLNEKTILLLKNQGLTIKNIPLKNRKIYLYDKVVLSCGTDIHDKTDDIHSDNKFLFLKLSQLLKAPIVGIDFICQNISEPYHKQHCAIIEANSLPYIDMHHFPVSGKPHDVAGYIIDSAFSK